MIQINLLMKNMILIKKHLIMLLAIAIILPPYMYYAVGSASPVLVPLYMQVSFVIFMGFNQLEMVEYKYKGNVLLCTTPFSRRAIVGSKYVFVSSGLILCLSVYAVMSVFLRKYLAPLEIASVIMVIVLILILYSIFIPLLLKFGYERTKYFPGVATIITPYLSVLLLKIGWLGNNSVLSKIGSQNIVLVAACIVGCLVVYLSIRISNRIYEKVDF